MKQHLNTALQLLEDGIACIPVGSNKIPVIGSWREYMERLPSKAELKTWFEKTENSIALIAGKVQCIDVDEKYRAGLMAHFRQRCIDFGIGEIFDRCICQKTPSGGYHLVFKSEGEPFRNMKLAKKSAKDNHEVLIETRGAGGYFLIAPSSSYELIDGDFAFLPTLTEDERNDLLDVARSFNEAAKEGVKVESASVDGDLKPGDDYDLRGDLPGLLRQHGWSQIGQHHWRRPGKDSGVSASFGIIPDRFWVWTTSTVFESEHVYRPYAVYAMLEHNGDFKAAATALATQGYGSGRKQAEKPLESKKKAPDRDFEAGYDVEIEPQQIITDLKRFSELKPSNPADGNNILGDRFLCRGSCAMLFGYSGVGKSSLITQLCICWALGKETLGLKPSQPLNILLIQAENDEGDLAEMRDGGMEGMIKSGLLKEHEAASALPYIWTVRVSSKCGDQVGPMLKQYCQSNEFDLIIMDPLFAYLGADSKDQKDVSHFLRNVIDPIISEHKVALLIVHHTNKPPKERSAMSVPDMAYLSSGSAELTNYPRGILAVLPTSTDGIYQLVAAKRGGRLGWGKDEDGKPILKRFIGHSDGYICWRELDDMEVAQAFDESQRPKNPNHPSNRSKDKAKRVKDAKVWLMSHCIKSADLLSNINNFLETEFQLTRDQDKRSVIKFVEETGNAIERVVAIKGKIRVCIVGESQKAHELKVKIEREYEQNKQVKIDSI